MHLPLLSPLCAAFHCDYYTNCQPDLFQKLLYLEDNVFKNPACKFISAKLLETTVEWYLPTCLPDLQTRQLVVRSPHVVVSVRIPLYTQTPGWSCTFEITLTEGVLTFERSCQEQQKDWRLLSRVAVTLSFCLFHPYDWGQGEEGLNFLMSNRKPFLGGHADLGISSPSYHFSSNSFKGVCIPEASTGSWNRFENYQLIQKQ